MIDDTKDAFIIGGIAGFISEDEYIEDIENDRLEYEEYIEELEDRYDKKSTQKIKRLDPATYDMVTNTIRKQTIRNRNRRLMDKIKREEEGLLDEATEFDIWRG